MALTKIDEKSNAYVVKVAPSVDGLYELYSKQVLSENQVIVKIMLKKRYNFRKI